MCLITAGNHSYSACDLYSPNSWSSEVLLKLPCTATATELLKRISCTRSKAATVITPFHLLLHIFGQISLASNIQLSHQNKAVQACWTQTFQTSYEKQPTHSLISLDKLNKKYLRVAITILYPFLLPTDTVCIYSLLEYSSALVSEINEDYQIFYANFSALLLVKICFMFRYSKNSCCLEKSISDCIRKTCFTHLD